MLNVKALVGAFNQEKALVVGLLRDCTTSPMDRFAALVWSVEDAWPGAALSPSINHGGRGQIQEMRGS